MWSVCVSDVAIVAVTVASLIHCYGTMYVHIELGGVSGGLW